jgi:hypothetical protein
MWVWLESEAVPTEWSAFVGVLTRSVATMKVARDFKTSRPFEKRLEWTLPQVANVVPISWF